MFFTSLRRTGAGYFDFYLLHNLGGDRTALYDKYGLWEFVREQKEKGLIRHIGFSWHDKADMLESVLTQHPDVEFVQLQINYADWESPSIESRKCYEVARRHNKPVVIMEPVKGGNLTRVPEQVRRIFADANPEPSLASWAIRFAASLDNVITVLSGMSTIEQMRDNVSYMGNFRPLDEDERIAVDRAREALAELSTIRCTACGYCSSGCPQHVGIPAILSAMNSFAQFGNLRAAKSRYARATCEGACIECGRCESVCPQHLEIRRHLKEAARLFE
jgi:predicted aldo/keto reductase-like oxidoreductase